METYTIDSHTMDRVWDILCRLTMLYDMSSEQAFRAMPNIMEDAIRAKQLIKEVRNVR